MKKFLLILVGFLTLLVGLIIYFRAPRLVALINQPSNTTQIGMPGGETSTTSSTPMPNGPDVTFTNNLFCYSLSYPSNFTLTTTTEGLANLKNYDTSIELHEAASPPGIAIQIQRAALTASTTLDEFIEKENRAIAADNEAGLPEDALGSSFSSTTLGVFRYSQETYAGPGGKFTSFLAPTMNGINYYSVLVWNKDQSFQMVNNILTSFEPLPCTVETSPAPAANTLSTST